METPPQQKNKNEVEEFGGIFGITLVIVLLIAGGVYFLYSQYQKIQADQQQAQQQTNS